MVYFLIQKDDEFHTGKTEGDTPTISDIDGGLLYTAPIQYVDRYCKGDRSSEKIKLAILSWWKGSN